MLRAQIVSIFRKPWTVKAAALAIVVSTVVYFVVAIPIYQTLEAGRPTLENRHPEHITGFPASLAFIVALFYAVPVLIVVFVIAWIAFSLWESRQRKRQFVQDI